MHRLLLFILWSFSLDPAFCQCRDATQQENVVYNKLVNIFDKALFSQLADNDWEKDGVEQSKDHLQVSESKNPRDRPFFICNAYHYKFSLHLKDNSARYRMIEDSLKWYDERYKENISPMVTDGQLDGKKFVALSPDKQKEIQDHSDAILNKKQALFNGRTITFETTINDPYFFISSPSSGFVASSYKKLDIPGCAIAYAVSLEPGNVSSSCRIILGFGKWPQKVSHDGDNIYISFPFVHHPPEPVIENFVIRIDVPAIDVGLKLIEHINWVEVG
jgi:hypothetical protein